MHVVSVVGARPQFVKAAVVSRELAAASGALETLVHTGQHFDANMSDVFFGELGIPEPAFNLGIGGGTHGQNTGRMLEAVEQVLRECRPDWVLVYGDTDSTLAGTLAAVKLHIPVAHVEAGLRSFNRRMPEEINRVLTDHAASLLLVPTEVAVRNLEAEGITGDAVRMVGDVMYDAALVYGREAEKRSDVLARVGLQPGAYVLATIHRPSNTDEIGNMRGILSAMAASRLPVVWPVHPRTRRRIAEFGLEIPPMVRAIEPVGYLDMVMLERHARVIATDSGGVQKEAFFHGVPCLTLRSETEWVELVELGVNRLIGEDWGAFAAALAAAPPEFSPRDQRQPYGCGDAAARIVRALQG
jgi:UDP-GlcNAc3NAcA epimerase